MFNDKPGKGVNPNEPEKKAVFRFFEVYFSRFTRIIPLNFLFCIIFLPIYSFVFLQLDIWSEASQAGQASLIDYFLLPRLAILTVSNVMPLAVLLLLASIVLYGPAMCGMTYILRNYARREHAWLSDFFVKMKENFLPGMLFGFLELAVFGVLIYNLTFEMPEQASDVNALIFPFVKILSAGLLLFVLMMRHYIYLMAVTFRLRGRDIVKNAAILAILGLGRNIAVIIVQSILLIPMIFISGYDVIALPIFYFGFSGFLTMFACWPLAHRHLVAPGEDE